MVTEKTLSYFLKKDMKNSHFILLLPPVPLIIVKPIFTKIQSQSFREYSMVRMKDKKAQDKL